MITDDSYLVPPAEGDYVSVRALTVRGPDTEIGSDLATLSRRDYGTVLFPYASSIYGKGRLAYFDQHYPALAARARGVAQIFGAGDDYDSSALGYDLPAAPPGCSLVWFPASLTTTGRPMFGRNLDWFAGTLSSQYGLPPTPGEHGSCSRTVLTTTVPPSGHAVAQLGCHDLMSPGLDGVNDAGLMIVVLVDHTDRGNIGADAAGGFSNGVSAMQLPGCVLNSASTVEEAKLVILRQSLFCPGSSNMHWFIADEHGAATVLEIDGDSRQYRFVDPAPGQPFIVTNHALHRYPTVDTFPQVPTTEEHNSFVRYRALTDAIGAHEGKWSPADISALLDVVLCAYVSNAAAGIDGEVPERTLWQYLADPTNRHYRFRFYRHDTDPVPGSNQVRVQFTDPMDWSLGGVQTPS